MDPFTSVLITESLFAILLDFVETDGAEVTEAGGEVVEVAKGCSLSEGQLVVSAVVAAWKGGKNKG